MREYTATLISIDKGASAINMPLIMENIHLPLLQHLQYERQVDAIFVCLIIDSKNTFI